MLNFLGALLIIIGAALIGITLLMQLQEFTVRYQAFLKILENFEDSVAAIPNKGLVIIAILLLYVAKSIIPIPTSAVCVIAGMVFPTPFAVAINIVGYIGLITSKYFWGKHLGRGYVYKILRRYENIQRLMDSNTKAKDGLLVGFRAVPYMPINTVSQVYGAMNFDYYKFILFSVVGFLPRIISYSLVGRHVYNPFSLGFMLPIVIMFVISGLAIIAVNAFIEIYNSRIKNT
ncbi:MAG: VTT domain-containing protein [Ruminococcaceae bacterium]|nr:VTT domain-containing protein [Oscillospiraceae bacterium]